MAAQTKKRSMTAYTASKISENPKKKKQIQHSDALAEVTISEDTVWI